MTTVPARAQLLRDLHAAPELLSVVNVWDVISAKVVAETPGTTALATASHSIAATFGYADGENIPFDLMLDMLERIAASTDLPVSADLEAGYGDPGEAVRRAIGVGIVGANLEDQMRPVAEAVERVAAAVAAAEQEGVPFALNARTDAFVRATEGPEVALENAIERGRAFLDAGATSVFVPGMLGEDAIYQLVEAYGPQKLTLIGIPGAVVPARMEKLGVARVSYGPWTQRVTLHALQNLTKELLGGGELPTGTPALN